MTRVLISGFATSAGTAMPTTPSAAAGAWRTHRNGVEVRAAVGAKHRRHGFICNTQGRHDAVTRGRGAGYYPRGSRANHSMRRVPGFGDGFDPALGLSDVEAPLVVFEDNVRRSTSCRRTGDWHIDPVRAVIRDSRVLPRHARRAGAGSPAAAARTSRCRRGVRASYGTPADQPKARSSNASSCASARPSHLSSNTARNPLTHLIPRPAVLNTSATVSLPLLRRPGRSARPLPRARAPPPNSLGGTRPLRNVGLGRPGLRTSYRLAPAASTAGESGAVPRNQGDD